MAGEASVIDASSPVGEPEPRRVLVLLPDSGMSSTPPLDSALTNPEPCAGARSRQRAVLRCVEGRAERQSTVEWRSGDQAGVSRRC
jgi:hypothetical protein